MNTFTKNKKLILFTLFLLFNLLNTSLSLARSNFKKKKIKPNCTDKEISTNVLRNGLINGSCLKPNNTCSRLGLEQVGEYQYQGVDKCIGKRKVREFFCKRGYIEYRDLNCPNGFHCNEGTCTEEVSSSRASTSQRTTAERNSPNLPSTTSNNDNTNQQDSDSIRDKLTIINMIIHQ